MRCPKGGGCQLVCTVCVNGNATHDSPKRATGSLLYTCHSGAAFASSFLVDPVRKVDQLMTGPSPCRPSYSSCWRRRSMGGVPLPPPPILREARRCRGKRCRYHHMHAGDAMPGLMANGDKRVYNIVHTWWLPGTYAIVLYVRTLPVDSRVPSPMGVHAISIECRVLVATSN